MNGSADSRRAVSRRVILAGLLSFLSIGAFRGVLQNGFVFDDAWYIVNNPALRQGLSAASVRWAFTAFQQSNWHPLTWLSHLSDVALFGFEPRGHHGVSLLLHAANAVLFYSLLGRLTGSIWRSALAAALFAVHPLRVESVAWVAERKDLLAAFFGLLALLAYAGYARRPSAGRYAGVTLLFGAGLMAKPMLVTLPFVLLLVDYWPLGRLRIAGPPTSPGTGPSRSPRPGRLLREKIPLVALAAASAAVTIVAQSRGGAVTGLTSFPAGVRLAGALWGYLAYLRKHFPPWDLAVFYPHAGAAGTAGKIATGFAVLAVLSALALLLRQRAPYLATGWFWYLGTLLPVIGLVQVGSQGLADRYTYLPSLGLLAAAVWGMDELLVRSRHGRPAGFALAVAGVLGLAVSTDTQVRYWKDEVTLYRRTLAVTRDNWVIENNLGQALAARGAMEEAAAHFTNALRVRPDFAEAHNNLGAALRSLGRAADALAQYREAVHLKPRLIEAQSALGALLLERGEVDEAVAHLREAVRQDSSYAPDRLELARALAQRREYGEALAQFEEAARLAPSLRADALAGAGSVLLAQGRRADAAASFAEALRLRPGHPAALAGYVRSRLESSGPP